MRRLPGPAVGDWATEVNSGGSLRIVSGLAENTNSIFCDGSSELEAANGCPVLRDAGTTSREALVRSKTIRSDEMRALLSAPRRSRAFHLTMTYMDVLWFLFNQTRYGTALALIVPAAVSGSLPLLFLSGTVASFVHKGAGRRGSSAGVVEGFAGSKARSSRCRDRQCCRHIPDSRFAGPLATLAGYGTYVGWWDQTLPAAHTPLKYYYMLAVLLAWKLRNIHGPHSGSNIIDRLLILTLLFLPLSYYVVFAGGPSKCIRLYYCSLYCRLKTPRPLQMFLLIPYFADLTVLLFSSGFYF